MLAAIWPVEPFSRDLRWRSRSAVSTASEAFAPDAIYESADAGIPLIVCIPERVPALDRVKVYRYVRKRGARLIWPNCAVLHPPHPAHSGLAPGRMLEPRHDGPAHTPAPPPMHPR